jgi:hypothetical protein
MKTQILMLALIISLSAAKVHAQVLCLTNTENALNAGNASGAGSASQYLKAINFAGPCIINFKLQALRIQHTLDSLKIAVPINPPYSAQQKAAIFHNGLLNDVATVCFYKGKAAEALFDMNKKKYSKYKNIAIAAFKLTLQFSKGRHWDNGGFFWSPSVAARDQLTELGQ